MALKEKMIEYYDGETCLEGYFAYNDAFSQPQPAVLISHAWGGRDQFVCDKAKKIVGLGYAAFALDLYGKGILGSGPDENAKLMQAFMDDRDLLLKRMNLALVTMKELDPVDANRAVAMGFCFGGLCVLDLARSGANLGGVISFHGLLMPPGNTRGKKINAKVLVMHGNDDPMVPVDDVLALQKELTEAGADWQIHSYGNTMHAFTNPVANDPVFGTVYNENADRRSWKSVENFLEEILN